MSNVVAKYCQIFEPNIFMWIDTELSFCSKFCKFDDFKKNQSKLIMLNQWLNKLKLILDQPFRIWHW